MVWKVVRKDQIKDYPPRTRVRLDGYRKTYIVAHNPDYSFVVSNKDVWPDGVYLEEDWDHYEVAVWVSLRG